MTTEHFTFKGSQAQGPAINLVAMSGMKFTEEEQERLWRHINPRTFLVDHLKVEELACRTPSSNSDCEDTQFTYRYNSKEGFVYALRNGLLALLREGETIRYREIQMPNHKLKRNLLSVGQACFVNYYPLFADSSRTREAVVNILRNETDYTEQSCVSRTIMARRILDAGRGMDALHLVLSSQASRLSPEIREAAESLLDRNSGFCAQLLTHRKHTHT